MTAQKKTKLEAVDDVEDQAELEAAAAPASAPDPEAEPEIEYVDIAFRGSTFKIPKEMDEWETEACLAMNQSNYVLAAKILLGDRQWLTLQALGRRRKDVREFLNVFADVIDRDCVA